METEKKAWLYARYPGHPDTTQTEIEALRHRAEKAGCEIIGSSMDIHKGWIRRSGYRKMLRAIKSGKVDRVYITRMGSISHSNKFLFSFFKTAMKHNAKVYASEVYIRNYANCYKIGHKVEEFATKHDLPFPWGMDE